MDNDISVEGRLGGNDETTSNSSGGDNSGNTVTLKPTNPYLPQTNSLEVSSLSLIGFMMCVTIIIGYGFFVLVHKKKRWIKV